MCVALGRGRGLVEGWIGALASREAAPWSPTREGANARNSAAEAKKGNENIGAHCAAHNGARGPSNAVRAPPWACSASCASLSKS